MSWFKRKKKIAYGFSSFEYKQFKVDEPRLWTTDGASNPMSGFAMLIPSGPFKEPPKPKRSLWGRLLCFIGLHDWVNPGISYYGPKHPRQCTRCKKQKWIS